MTVLPIRALAEERQPPLVLVVEDDAIIREIIRDVLEEEGFAVALAADGLEATLHAIEQPPALVILDMGLPLVDGERVGVSLRARHGASLPIVTISAGVGLADKARRLGAVGYLRKPFDLDALVIAVRRGLEPAR